MNTYQSCEMGYKNGLCIIDDQPCHHPPVNKQELCSRLKIAEKDAADDRVQSNILALDDIQHDQSIAASRKKLAQYKIL
jgi:hypothetical protein